MIFTLQSLFAMHRLPDGSTSSFLASLWHGFKEKFLLRTMPCNKFTILKTSLWRRTVSYDFERKNKVSVFKAVKLSINFIRWKKSWLLLTTNKSRIKHHDWLSSKSTCWTLKKIICAKCDKNFQIDLLSDHLQRQISPFSGLLFSWHTFKSFQRYASHRLLINSRR